MSGWLDGIERVPNTHSRGGTYQPGVPWRFVVHTVEGDPRTVSDCRLIAEAHQAPPHLWYAPRYGWYGQTVPLDRSAFALAHPRGAPETNKAGALQVEVFGYAADTGDWPDDWLDGIAYLIRRCINAGYPVDLSEIAATTGSDGYGPGGTVRFDWPRWATFPGLCGHANVPGNDHWDPGRLDLARIAELAAPSPTAKDDDMTPGQTRDLTGRKWFFVVGDDRRMYASVEGGEFFPVDAGWWTSGLDAYTETDGTIVVAGRGLDGVLYQVLVYTDGSPTPDRPPVLDRVGGHIFPPA
jgi:hypothetical protein